MQAKELKKIDVYRVVHSHLEYLRQAHVFIVDHHFHRLIESVSDKLSKKGRHRVEHVEHKRLEELMHLILN